MIRNIALIVYNSLWIVANLTLGAILTIYYWIVYWSVTAYYVVYVKVLFLGYQLGLISLETVDKFFEEEQS